ncbi:MAG: glycosyltransferase family 2 protein [Gemmatimonadaceae bacterium]|nr:glycosyltransferase family 2 protein [Gemmatimonadaceae bacterium]
MTFVSVIVPVFNDAERLGRCLTALEAQTYPSDSYEVVVLDNGSQPPLTDLLGVFAHVRLVGEPRPGVSRARVTGIEHARGEVLAFTDSDCLPEPGWLANGVACLQQTTNRGVVGGRIEMFDDGSGPSSIATTLSVATHLKQDRFLKGHWAVCANLFTSRRIVAAVGGMNPALISSGEVEWCQRVHAAGYELAYAVESVVRHPARSSIRALCQRAVRHEYAWAQLRETATLGRGFRFWVGQHLVWPLRDIHRDLLRSSRLTLVEKIQTSALAVLLMHVRMIAWFALRLGIPYEVRANWG